MWQFMIPALFLLQESLEALQEGLPVCRLSVISHSTRSVLNHTPGSGKERGGERVSPYLSFLIHFLF